MTRRSRTNVATSPSATLDLERAPRFETREQRLGALAGSLALRASDWGWARIFDRWRSGKPVPAFHRKFLAVSSHYRALSSDRVYDHHTIAGIRALPERSR